LTTAKEIFLDALELPEAERAAFLEQRCGADQELRRDVERLLGASDESSQIFGTRALGGAPQGVAAGVRVGSYALVEEIGEGGFATVWRAQQTEPVTRSVAVKILKAGMDSREVVSRFEAEHQALALMDHPGIAKVFDGGVADFGRSWFAMELVDGEPITEYCNRHGLNRRQRLTLFLRVCRAVQHAHQKGVIHRDIKPSNVLVGEIDGQAVPKVIDFGIAKAIDRQLSENSVLTLEGQVVGTPAYMSPEQVGDSNDIDTRSDVYALGALLYELLSGSRPFEDETLAQAGLVEVLRIIRDVDPPRPSSRTSTVTNVAARELKGDLDWIIMRCLEKDRDRRYDSAGVLANDVERHLAGEPVLAGPPDLGYRVRKFVTRHRISIGFAVVLVILLVGGIVVSLSQLLRAHRAEAELREQVQRTETELAKFAEISRFFEAIITGVDPAFAQGKDTELLRRILDDASARADEELGSQPEVEATVRHAIGGAYHSLALLGPSEKQFLRTIALRREVLAEDDPDRYMPLIDLGVVYMLDQRFDEAEPFLIEGLTQLRKLCGPNDRRTLRAMGAVGILYRGQKRFAEAEKILRDAEARWISEVGQDDSSTITVINNLASALSEGGKLEEAAERYRLALELQLRVHGELHPSALMALNNLGSALHELNRIPEAIPCLEDALNLKRDVFPDGHQSLYVSFNNLAQIHEEVGAFERARPYYEEALEMMERTDTSHGARAVQLRGNYGLYLDKIGEPGAAVDVLRRCLELASESFGPDGALTVTFESMLGWQLVKVGQTIEAEELLRSSVDKYTSDPHSVPATAGVFRIRLGVALRDLAYSSEAIAVLQPGLAQVRAAGIGEWIRIGENTLRSLDVEVK